MYWISLFYKVCLWADFHFCPPPSSAITKSSEVVMKMDTVDIVLTGDEKYVMPMGVAMYSIVRNLAAGRTARFFLLVSGWSEEDEQKIRQLKDCEIVIIPVERHLDYFKGTDPKTFKNWWTSLACYYRLLIPKILPEDVDKVFYFDGDMIADADLAKIYDEMPGDKLLAAVIDLVANAHSDRNLKHLRGWEEFAKFNEDQRQAPYFNAGFFIMNLKLARKLDIFGDFMNFLAAHPTPPYADQDTLNAVCGQKHSDKMLYLPPQWNVFAYTNYNADFYMMAGYTHHEIRNAFENPLVIHYGGESKPWLTHHDLHHRNIWQGYYELSPFSLKARGGGRKSDEYISWMSLFFIPIFKMKSDHIAMRKGYLFGFIPLFRKFANKINVYALGLPMFKIEWQGGRIRAYLFGCIPIFQLRGK
jgi:lipopolysaccharide biosynthesis glycosyltransferase